MTEYLNQTNKTMQLEKDLKHLSDKPKTTVSHEYSVFEDENDKNSFLDRLRQSHQTQNTNCKSSLSIDKIKQINQTIMEKYKLQSEKEAVMFIGVLCQLGGTSNGCDGNLSYTNNNITVVLSDVKRVFLKLGLKKSIRKYARTNAYTIFQMCLALGIKGNLSIKIQKLNPNREFSLTEMTWLSDFQINSEAIPPELRCLIRQSFLERNTKKGNSRKGRQ